MKLNKRSNLSKIIFTLVIVSMLSNSNIRAQKELDVVKNTWLIYSDAPNSLYNHLTSEAFKLLESRAEKNLKLKTPEEWRQHQKITRQTLWEIIGSFPEKTALNARIRMPGE